MIRMFVGRVETIEDNQIITFSISDIQESMSPFPSASPMTKLSRYPKVGDEVLILQPDKDFEIFVYTITPDDEFDISLQYESSYIKISKSGDTYPINVSSEDSLSININDKSTINVNGDTINLKVENSEIKISSDKIIANVNGKSITHSDSKLDIFGQVEVTP